MTQIEPEVLEAVEVSRSGLDFLVRGGAGSGKTHSMMGFLDQVYASDPRLSVACVTFTNVAVNEIRERFPYPHLRVSTVHEFVWSLISRYQKNLRTSLAELINSGEIKSDLTRPLTPSFWSEPIQYKEWLNLEAGEVSHEEVLKLAGSLFAKHPTLSRILSDQYDFLLVDEYQDTPLAVLKILLEEMPEPRSRTLTVGFFGDGEQAIHEGDKGKATVEAAIASRRIHMITKKENRRNPAAVISVINRLRLDGLVQVQASHTEAPNFGKTGTARFIYTEQLQLSTDRLQELDFCTDWKFSSDETKLLYLGKSMIAREKQFPRLMAIYDKDRVVEYSKKIRDHLGKQGESIPEGVLCEQVLSTYSGTIHPTPAQQRAFDEDESLLEFAALYRFDDLISTSSNSDQLIGIKKVSDLDDRERGEKRDPLINHLIAIQELKNLFRQGKFSQVIRAVDAAITSVGDRNAIAENLMQLSTMDSLTVGEVASFAEKSGLLKRKDAVLKFEARHPYRYARVINVPFSEIVNLHEYVEDHSPYSTQHGVKGSEWANIFVSLDNGGWNNYNFEKLLAEPQSLESVHSRSRMMLYVTCSRAKDNLIVYLHRPTSTSLTRAREWFGDENVVKVG